MHLHSFQDIELKLHMYVNNSTQEVVERLTILSYLKRAGNKGLTTQKSLFRAHSHSFQDIEQVSQRLHGTGRKAVYGLTVPRRGQK